MIQILLTLSIPGAILLFVLIKTGLRLIFPFAICVVLGLLGMGLLVWSIPTAEVNNANPVGNPVLLMASLTVGAAAFGVFLLGIVVLARWFSGEYSSVKEGHET